MSDTNPHADRVNISPADEAQHFIEQCQALAAAPCTAESAPKFRALQAAEVKLRGELKKAHEIEKRPHLEAGRAVDAKYNPLIAQIQDAVKAVTRSLTAFMEAEHAKREAEARAAKERAEEERRRAEALAAQAEAEDDPFAAFDAGEEARRAEAEAASLARQAASPVKVNVTGSEGGRAAGLRTVGYIVDIIDPAALVAHYAGRADVIEAARKCAAAEAKSSKGEAVIPGVRITADRRAA